MGLSEDILDRMRHRVRNDFDTVLWTAAEMLDGPTSLSALATDRGELTVHAGGLSEGGRGVFLRMLRERFPVTIDVRVEMSQ